MTVQSESEVTQSCPTLRDPMDRSPPGSSVHESFQARALEWGATAFSNLLSWITGIKHYAKERKPDATGYFFFLIWTTAVFSLLGSHTIPESTPAASVTELSEQRTLNTKPVSETQVEFTAPRLYGRRVREAL